MTFKWCVVLYFPAASEFGVVFVTAAGNSNDDSCYYSPARMSWTVTVAAIDKSDVRSKDKYSILLAQWRIVLRPVHIKWLRNWNLQSLAVFIDLQVGHGYFEVFDRFCFELSGHTNYSIELLLYPLMSDGVITRP